MLTIYQEPVELNLIKRSVLRALQLAVDLPPVIVVDDAVISWLNLSAKTAEPVRWHRRPKAKETKPTHDPISLDADSRTHTHT